MGAGSTEGGEERSAKGGEGELGGLGARPEHEHQQHPVHLIAHLPRARAVGPGQEETKEKMREEDRRRRTGGLERQRGVGVAGGVGRDRFEHLAPRAQRVRCVAGLTLHELARTLRRVLVPARAPPPLSAALALALGGRRALLSSFLPGARRGRAPGDGEEEEEEVEREVPAAEQQRAGDVRVQLRVVRVAEPPCAPPRPARSARAGAPVLLPGRSERGAGWARTPDAARDHRAVEEAVAHPDYIEDRCVPHGNPQRPRLAQHAPHVVHSQRLQHPNPKSAPTSQRRELRPRSTRSMRPFKMGPGMPHFPRSRAALAGQCRQSAVERVRRAPLRCSASVRGRTLRSPRRVASPMGTWVLAVPPCDALQLFHCLDRNETPSLWRNSPFVHVCAGGCSRRFLCLSISTRDRLPL